jgi:hypothetical protein
MTYITQSSLALKITVRIIRLDCKGQTCLRTQIKEYG